MLFNILTNFFRKIVFKKMKHNKVVCPLTLIITTHVNTLLYFGWYKLSCISSLITRLNVYFTQLMHIIIIFSATFLGG